MVTDHIAGADGVHADLRRWTFADQTFATMRDIRFKIQAALLAKDLRETLRRSTRRVLLQTMMRLDDLEIEIFAEQLTRFSREPEERVNADAEV